MTYQDINLMLQDVGLPYAYYQFSNDTGQQPPFICFYYPNNDDVFADNLNYQRITSLIVELYTDNKDFVNEANVERHLTYAGLTYTKEETYIEEESMYLVTYTMEVLING